MVFFDAEDLLDLFLTDELFEGTLIGILLAIVIAAVLCAWLIWLRRSCPGRTFLSLLLIGFTATCLTFLPLAAGPFTSWLLSTVPNDVLTQHCLMATFAVGIYITAVLRQPTRIPGHVGPLLAITDGDFYSRVRELADRMRIATPAVRMARSNTADHATMAFAGGLIAPSIIVTDGILTRLTADERDAIVGHELAHIANGTFWYLMVVASMAGTGIAIAQACGASTSVLIGAALFVGLQRVVMRRLELDCDLRAARAIGFPETATALKKIHRLGIDGHTSPKLREMIHATGSHPSLAARLEHLKNHAPSDDQSRMPDPGGDETRIAWWAAAGWLLLVVTGWWLGSKAEWLSVVTAGVLLLAATLTPWLLLLASQSKEVLKLQLMRFAKAAGWVALGILALGILSLSGFATEAMDESEYPMIWLSILLTAVPALCIVFIVIMSRTASRNSFQSNLLTAWEGHDFVSVLKHIKRNRQFAKSDPDVLYREAMAHAILGERSEAIRLFENLVERHPEGINYHIALTATLIEMSQTENALKLCDIIISKFPKTGIGQAIAARCLRRLGRFDEARIRIRQGIECNPQIGAFYAAEAGIAADQGEFDVARDLLRKAGEIAPGTPQELVEDARLAIRTEPQPITIQKLKRAIEALKANPLILRQSELKSLRRELNRLSGDAATVDEDSAEWVTELVDDADMATEC